MCELESRERNCELLRPPLPVAQTFSASTRVFQVFCLSRPPVRYSIAHSRLRRSATSRRLSDVERGQRTGASGTQRRGRNKCSTGRRAQPRCHSDLPRRPFFSALEKCRPNSHSKFISLSLRPPPRLSLLLELCPVLLRPDCRYGSPAQTRTPDRGLLSPLN